MQNFDIAAQFGWQLYIYPMTLAHNVQATVPTGIVPQFNPKPVAVFMLDSVIPSESNGLLNTLVGFAWSLDGDNKPLVTATYSNNVTAQCRVCVAYRN